MANTLKDRLMTAQQQVVSGFVGEGIEVVFDAKETSYADLKKRKMHLMPIPENISKNDLIKLRAQVDRELGHLLWSDTVKAKTKEEDALLKAIENGRIEAKLADRWFGISENIQACTDNVAKDIKKGVESGGIEPLAGFMCALPDIVKGQSDEMVIDKYGEEIAPFVHALRASGIANKFKGMKSTRDSLRVAQELAAFLFQEQEPEPEGEGEDDGDSQKKPKKGDKSKSKDKSKDKGSKGSKGDEESDDDSESDSGDEEGDGSEDGEEGDDEGSSGSGSGDGEESDGSGDDQDLSESEEGDGADPEEVKVPRILNLSKAIGDFEKHNSANVIKVKASDIKSDARSYLSDTSRDQVMAIEETQHSPHSAHFSKEYGSKFFSDLKNYIPLLRRRMMMEFLAPVRVFERHKRKGSIDTRSLWKVGHGSDKVFRQKRPHLEVNADLCLLIDMSGSMSGDKIETAAKSAAVFSEVLDLLGVRHEVLGFTTGHSRAPTGERTEDLRHYVIKPLGKKFHACRENFPKIVYQDMRNNIDGESVLWAAQRLASFASKGAKRAMVVFSDGFPAGYLNLDSSRRGQDRNDILSNHLEDVVKRVEAAGIPIAGVGIQSDSVKRFYKKHIVVHEVSELGEQFVQLVRGLLRESQITV